ncbi:MAG TPA: TonB-dependent receptor [Flavisolibacter sp.]
MKKFFLVAAIIISSHIQAQQDTTQLEQVTVTAGKFSTKTTETGKLVTIITRDQIEKAGSRDLAQVITELGGVYINGYSGNPGKEKNIYLRGALPAHTLVTIDGIPVFDASGIGGNFDIRNISVDNVERIEILRGSQGTLYGTDAIAGVVNIITKKTTAKTFALTGTAHYGSFNTWRAATTVSGNSKMLDYSAGFAHFSTDGFSEAARPGGVMQEFDKDGYTQNSFQFQSGIRPLNGLQLRPYFRYARHKASLDIDGFVDEDDYTSDVKNLQAGLRNSYAAGQTMFHLNYQYQYTERSYLNDSTGSQNGYYIFSSAVYDAREHFMEGYAVHSFRKVKLTAGIDHRFSSTGFESTEKNIFSPALISASQGHDSIRQRQTSGYAAVNLTAGDFRAEGGARLNHHSEYGNNIAWNVNPSWMIGNALKVFINYSTGYKTPNLYQLFSAYGNRELQPESSRNVEAGVQYFSRDRKNSIAAAVFSRRVKDVITFFYDQATFRSFYINQDRQKDRGFELEGSWQPISRLQLKARYDYVDGEVTTKVNGKDTTYFNLLRRPKSLFTFSASAQVTPSLLVSANLVAAGKITDLDFSTFPFTEVSIGGYQLVNVYVEYALLKNKLKLFADCRNLLDQSYQDVYGYNTAGRNVYGGIKVSL